MLRAGARDPPPPGVMGRETKGLASGIIMSDTPSWHPTLPITREADQSWDWVSALWVVGTLPKAFVLLWITTQWLQGTERVFAWKGLKDFRKSRRMRASALSRWRGSLVSNGTLLSHSASGSQLYTCQDCTQERQ